VNVEVLLALDIIEVSPQSWQELKLNIIIYVA
jgi:hypothetical protein